MKVLITALSNGRITGVVQTGAPEVGREYFLEDARNGTLAQNRMLHLLLRIYFDQEGYSWPAKTLSALKKYVLRDLGAGFEWIAYVTEDGKIAKAGSRSELPPYVQKDQALGAPKSWALYGLKERRMTISALITQMEHDGVNGKVFDEIVAEHRA